MCVITDESERELPASVTLISNNTISQVWRGHDGFVYKRSIPFLIENEIGILKRIESLGISPKAWRYDKYTIKMEDLGLRQDITNKTMFRKAFRDRVKMLHNHGIRHGDLTLYSLIIRNNIPFFIDFAESRYITDPRPDKRPEGDAYWVERTINELTGNI